MVLFLSHGTLTQWYGDGWPLKKPASLSAPGGGHTHTHTHPARTAHLCVRVLVALAPTKGKIAR